ncbi:hypothetical protein WJX74_000070 [Apatococcus lobatus]|uniref:UMP-CMP kinase n=1 Tax=Apatococcus lobatus TaxID=904363 RepID=A0AAW1RNW9_9CHLO
MSFRSVTWVSRQLRSALQGSTAAALQRDSASLASQQVTWSRMSFGAGLAAAGLATFVTSLPQADCAPAMEKGQAPPINLAKAGFAVPKTSRKIVFVLGGPGSGKGTQCSRLVAEYDLVHLSAGDLLRAHMKSGTTDGQMVADMIKNGQIVPSYVTVNLLDKAMADSGKTQFLIDGFPRNEENRAAFEKTGMEPEFILFFNCPEAVMEKRLMGRNEGRTDDNAETIRKRFKVFLESSMPIIDYYNKQGKVRKVDADRDPSTVFSEVRKLFEQGFE